MKARELKKEEIQLFLLENMKKQRNYFLNASLWTLKMSNRAASYINSKIFSDDDHNMPRNWWL
jgi:hypothetical protein